MKLTKTQLTDIFEKSTKVRVTDPKYGKIVEMEFVMIEGKWFLLRDPHSKIFNQTTRHSKKEIVNYIYNTLLHKGSKVIFFEGKRQHTTHIHGGS